MLGYHTYKDESIRVSAAGYEVAIGTAKPCVKFVRFEQLKQAEQFIDGGKIVTNHVIYSTTTGKPV